eukprot:NODE_4_length_77007_cov_1.156642.p57 type:complete len:185 gc:universal NODE_4_length_77007_cov_1.156642:11967-12521(+)
MMSGVYPPGNDSNAAKFHRQTVSKCFQKSEVLLKIAMNHLQVADVLVNTFVMMTDTNTEGNVIACSTEEIFKEKSRKRSLLKLLEFRGAQKADITKIMDKYTTLYNDTESVDLTLKEEDKSTQGNWKKLFATPPPAPIQPNPLSPVNTNPSSEPKVQQSGTMPPSVAPTATAGFMNYFSSFNKK